MSLEICDPKCPVFAAYNQISRANVDTLRVADRAVAISRAAFVNAFYAIDLSTGVRTLEVDEYDRAVKQVELLADADCRKLLEENPEFLRGVLGCVEKILVTESCLLENIARLPH